MTPSCARHLRRLPQYGVMCLVAISELVLLTTSEDTFRKAPLECKKTDKGAEYKGTLSKTEDGHSCQRWSDQFPHAHSFNNSFLFPEMNITLAHAHCRNPAGIKERPWCFTTSKDVRWQYCDIPKCGCRKSKAGWDYAGRISVTLSGRRCQPWAEQTPHAHSYSELSSFPDESIEVAGDFCRNPDRWETKGPWCYTADPLVRWEYCYVPYCECKVSPGGHQYGGKISRTRSGLRCQRWDSQTPHAHRYNDKGCAFPDDVVSSAANNCRNPEPNELGGPWCFTTDPDVRWEYCEIPLCGTDKDSEIPSAENQTLVMDSSRAEFPKDISRVELIFLSLFAASLLLTFTTIAAAVVVVHVYRKRNQRRATCATCANRIVRVAMDENADNAEILNRKDNDSRYEHGLFGDTVYIATDRSPDHYAPSAHAQHHTYDTISSASRSDVCKDMTAHDHRTTETRRHDDRYVNSRCEHVISPLKLPPRQDVTAPRRSSVS